MCVCVCVCDENRFTYCDFRSHLKFMCTEETNNPRTQTLNSSETNSPESRDLTTQRLNSSETNGPEPRDSLIWDMGERKEADEQSSPGKRIHLY